MRDHNDGKPQRRVWTPEAVEQVGMTTNVETAAAILGMSRTLAFDLGHTGGSRYGSRVTGGRSPFRWPIRSPTSLLLLRGARSRTRLRHPRPIGNRPDQRP